MLFAVKAKIMLLKINFFLILDTDWSSDECIDFTMKCGFFNLFVSVHDKLSLINIMLQFLSSVSFPYNKFFRLESFSYTMIFYH